MGGSEQEWTGGPCGCCVPQWLGWSSSQAKGGASSGSRSRLGLETPPRAGAATGKQEGTALPWPHVGSGFLFSLAWGLQTPLNSPQEPASVPWFPS